MAAGQQNFSIKFSNSTTFKILGILEQEIFFHHLETKSIQAFSFTFALTKQINVNFC